MRLNIGCGRQIFPGWTNLDVRSEPGVDLVADLERCADRPLLLADDSVDELLAAHVLEHITNILPLMQELWRVAKPGAQLLVRCPYGSSNDADEDPTHVRRMYERSFNYFGQPYYWRADYGYRGDWRVERLILRMKPDVDITCGWEQIGRLVRSTRNVVDEMIAVLLAVKPARAQRAELQTAFAVEIAPHDITTI